MQSDPQSFRMHQHDPQLSDEELLTNVCTECCECFALLFQRHYRAVFATAWKILRDRGEAEDVAQEVFLSIYKQREQYDPNRGSARSWILAFAYFKALIRRRYLRIRSFYAVDELSALDETLLDVCWRSQSLNSEEWKDYVEKALASLRGRQRQTIELIHFEGYTLQEVSVIMQEGLSNTKNHYYRGMKSLRNFLDSSRVPMQKEQNTVELFQKQIRNKPIPLSESS